MHDKELLIDLEFSFLVLTRNWSITQVTNLGGYQQGDPPHSKHSYHSSGPQGLVFVAVILQFFIVTKCKCTLGKQPLLCRMQFQNLGCSTMRHPPQELLADWSQGWTSPWMQRLAMHIIKKKNSMNMGWCQEGEGSLVYLKILPT